MKLQERIIGFRRFKGIAFPLGDIDLWRPRHYIPSEGQGPIYRNTTSHKNGILQIMILIIIMKTRIE
jgi:hypothetical protein